MSRYRFIRVLIIAVCLIGALQAGTRGLDAHIIEGIWYEQNGAHSDAKRVFAKLYDTTKQKVFLLKEVRNALLAKEGFEEALRRFEIAGIDTSSIEELRLLIPLYGSLSRFDEAIKLAHRLLEISDEAQDYDIAAYTFLLTSRYDDAARALEKLYEKTGSEENLLRLVSILEYQKRNKEAIALLESHRRFGFASKSVYARLLELYKAEKNIEGVIETYKGIYEAYPDNSYLDKLIQAYAFKGDLEEAVAYLESIDAPKEALYDLYKATKCYDKALELAKHFYAQKQKPQWIAEEAVLIFESAVDKSDTKMLKRVVELFEKALQAGVDDSIYLNYYGYILIDYDIDVDKGIEVVQNALQQQPENTYYLDSLAWGYFKKGKCKEAYEIMKRVVEVEGLKEQEIVDHWKAIKHCK